MFVFYLVDLIIKQSALINYLAMMISEHELHFDEIEKDIDELEKLIDELEADLK
jgi:hypothetical protein